MNGCGLCIDSCEKILKGPDVAAEAAQSAVRTASVMKVVATVHAATA